MSPSPNGKICTVIRECAPGDFERAVLESRRDSDLLEFRLDYLDPSQLTPQRMQRWVALAGVPVIGTLRRKPFGGRFEGGAIQQLEMLGRIRGAGFSFLDIEVETLEAVDPTRLEEIRDGSWRLIGSYHNFRDTPSDLQAVFQRILAVNADVVKIATLAADFADNFRLLELVSQGRRQGLPVIAVAMGELGVYSRLVAPSRGALLTYATTRAGQETAPGQFTSRDLNCVYGLNSIDAGTLFYGVIGHPIGHSLSPQVHNYAFRQLGLNCRYLPLPTPDLEAFAPYLKRFGGLSVTLPHKVGVLRYVSSRHPSVAACGAANTLVRRDEGLWAYNTDLDGVRHALRDCLDGPPGRAVLLGAGGAARSAAAVLRDAGWRVTVLARKRSKAEALAGDFGFEADSLDRSSRYSGDLLINATPVGMSPAIHESPVPGEELRYGTVFDMVYNPLETRLLREAGKRARVVSGLEMFVGQAARQCFLWTGREASLQGMREVVLRRMMNDE
ncbi:MAG: shikimate dehydrogenase [Acidobacteriota bacterium]|nr:shikimate dehydrogenase [Acidobacteriota bacterium]MDE2965003.1 shikimate dehydrogenase [Acidobacteriota bacterium]